jgi:hypothetical protein
VTVVSRRLLGDSYAKDVCKLAVAVDVSDAELERIHSGRYYTNHWDMPLWCHNASITMCRRVLERKKRVQQIATGTREKKSKAYKFASQQ